MVLTCNILTLLAAWCIALVGFAVDLDHAHEAVSGNVGKGRKEEDGESSEGLHVG